MIGFSLGVSTSLGALLSLNNPSPVSPPPALLMGSRFNQMGFNGYLGSDATDTDSNSRIGSFNETGASVTKVRAYFPNWMATATNEQAGFNAITVSAAIEYPAGTLTRMTFGGNPTVTVAVDGLAETDEITLSNPVPAGSQYWIRTYVSVPSGLKWPQGYLISGGMGEAADFSTGLDKTLSGTIGNMTPASRRRGYGPIAVKATGFAGTPIGRAFAGLGDSLVMGASDAADPVAIGRGNAGYIGKAMAGRFPYLNLGLSGSKASDNQANNLTRRLAVLQKVGITDIIGDYSVNDLGAGASATTVRNNIQNIAAALKSAVQGIRVAWTTATPRTSSTDAWKTVANQTPFANPAGAYTGGTSSARSQLNALIRGGLTGVDRIIDIADASETSRDSGIWRAGEGSSHLTNTAAASDAMTSDGQHPTAFNTSPPGLGGIYVLRDFLIADLANWTV